MALGFFKLLPLTVCILVLLCVSASSQAAKEMPAETKANYESLLKKEQDTTGAIRRLQGNLLKMEKDYGITPNSFPKGMDQSSIQHYKMLRDWVEQREVTLASLREQITEIEKDFNITRVISEPLAEKKVEPKKSTVSDADIEALKEKYRKQYEKDKAQQGAAAKKAADAASKKTNANYGPEDEFFDAFKAKAKEWSSNQKKKSDPQSAGNGGAKVGIEEAKRAACAKLYSKLVDLAIWGGAIGGAGYISVQQFHPLVNAMLSNNFEAQLQRVQRIKESSDSVREIIDALWEVIPYVKTPEQLDALAQPGRKNPSHSYIEALAKFRYQAKRTLHFK